MKFIRKTTTYTTKPIPKVIVILYSKEKTKVGLQHVIQEQPRLVLESKHVEDKKL
jgi:hypothetical protein